MQQYLITKKSGNAKTGPIMVTTSARKTCPKACPFNRDNAGGCYADGGPLRMVWDKMSATPTGATFSHGRAEIEVKSFDDLITAISQQTPGALWRHNQAGDLAGNGNAINSKSLAAITLANTRANARGFTYTHKPVMGKTKIAAANRTAVKRANLGGFTVNLSANNPAHADELAALDVAPVVTVLPLATTENTTTPQGRKIVVCPAQTRDDVTCKSCGLCQRQRDFIIGFIAHGQSKKRVDQIVNAE